MCTMCKHSLPDTNNIDDLLKAYELQQQEVYINRTIPTIDELSDITFAGLLGLAIGINVLVRIIFTLTS